MSDIDVYKPTKEDIQEFNETAFCQETHFKYSNISRKIKINTCHSLVYTRVFKITLTGKTFEMTKFGIVNLIQAALMGFDDLKQLSRAEVVQRLSLFGFTEDYIRIAIDPEMSDTDWQLLIEGKEYPYLNAMWLRLCDPRVIENYRKDFNNEYVRGKCLPYPIFLQPFSSSEDDEHVLTRKLLIDYTDSELRPMYHLVKNELLQGVTKMTDKCLETWTRDLLSKLQYYNLRFLSHMFGCSFAASKGDLITQITLYLRGLHLMLRYFGCDAILHPSTTKRSCISFDIDDLNIHSDISLNSCNPEKMNFGGSAYKQVYSDPAMLFAYFKRYLKQHRASITQEKFREMFVTLCHRSKSMLMVCKTLTLSSYDAQYLYQCIRNATHHSVSSSALADTKFYWREETFEKIKSCILDR